MRCAVGIMAHNEGANIAAAMRSVLAQTGTHVGTPRLIVVASGCTDDTVEKAQAVAREDRRVDVIVQPERLGKASAINRFLAEAAGSELLVLAGGDTRLEPGSLEALLAPFDDPRVGMTGGRPVPVNSERSLLGRVVRLQWDLHDAVARKKPKLGELVAFRAILDRMDESTAVDEAFLEASVLSRSLRTVYAPDAKVAMKGPTRLSDFIAQRRRIHAGHVRLRSSTGHEVSTLGLSGALRAGLALRREGRATLPTIVSAAFLEAVSRSLGAWDARIARKTHHAWRSIPTTKDLTP